MTRYKAGMHKKISSIFDGVPVQGQSAPAAVEQPTLPDFVTESNETTGPVQSPARPVQKLYKDAAEKTTRPASKVNTRKKTGIAVYIEAIRSKLLPHKAGVDRGRQAAMLIVVPVLFIVLVVVFFKFVLPGSPSRINVPQMEAVANAASASAKINWQLPKPYTALPRDPMRSASSVQLPGQDGQNPGQFSSFGEVTLTGIVYSEDNPTAILGSQVMHAGEKIGDCKISKIERNSVTLERNGQTKVLRVGQSWLSTE
jgi:hypothetical protein